MAPHILHSYKYILRGKFLIQTHNHDLIEAQKLYKVLVQTEYLRF